MRRSTSPGPASGSAADDYGRANGWSLAYAYLGQGDIAPVTHEIQRRAEPGTDRRPIVRVG
jgi:hypothetical protein